MQMFLVHRHDCCCVLTRIYRNYIETWWWSYEQFVIQWLPLFTSNVVGNSVWITYLDEQPAVSKYELVDTIKSIGEVSRDLRQHSEKGVCHSYQLHYLEYHCCLLHLENKL